MDSSVNPGSFNDESSNDSDYQASADLSNAIQSFEQSVANDPILNRRIADDYL